MIKIATDPRNIQVLIVEDEMTISMALEETLEEFGCSIVGPAHTLPAALSLAEIASFDVALLDVSLKHVEAFPVADILVSRGIPFIFMTGHRDFARHAQYKNAPILLKPFSMSDVRGIIEQTLEQS